jgi:hypothetical protein
MILLSLKRVDGLVRLRFLVRNQMVLGEASPRPPVEEAERLPTPKRRRSANKLPYVRVGLAELARCLY